MKRVLSHLVAAGSLLLSIGACVLWVRALSASEQLTWRYDRWLADRSAASTVVSLTSERRRIWLDLSWGRVGPPNGQLVWGYYVNADQSGGRPRLDHDRQPYDPMMDLIYAGGDPRSGLGPVRWQFGRRSPPKDGDDHRSIHLGISHWLAALLLLVPPLLWALRVVRERRLRRAGHCPDGYDLRATPERCPECGRPCSGRAASAPA